MKNVNTTLCAAEYQALRSPATENVKASLSLLLRELALKGWVRVVRKKRAIQWNVWIMVILAVLAFFALHFLAGFAALIIGLIAFIGAQSAMPLITLTDKGRLALQQTPDPFHLPDQMLRMVNNALRKSSQDCTPAEWRRQIGKTYVNNADFHERFILKALLAKGMVAKIGDQYEITPAGSEALAAAEAQLNGLAKMPEWIRSSSPEAVPALAALGVLVLLAPELEGYYAPMGELMRREWKDLDDTRKYGDGSDGGYIGSSDSGSERKPAEDQSDWNDLDYDSSSDFLDGAIDTDSTGVGSDSDGGGCSGDGGGDGGCGGGCGGGD